MSLAMAHAAIEDSPTLDEPNHLVRGVAFYSGDASLSIAHPPLANALQGLPGLLLGPDVDVRTLEGWSEREIFSVSRAYFAADYPRARAALVAGRFVTLMMTLALGVYLYGFALRWGRLCALLVAAGFALSPTLLAHGHLVTTDVPITACFVVAACEMVRYLERGSLLRLATTCMAAACGAATKLSGPLLILGLGVAAITAAVLGIGFFASLGPAARVRRVARDGLALAFTTVLVVNAAYLFRDSGWRADRILAHPEPRSYLTKRYDGRAMESLSPIALLPAATPVPLPYPYLYGAATVRAQQERGHGGRLFGIRGKSPLYFPAMLVVKSTLAMGVLLVGAALALRRRRRWRRALRSPLVIVPLCLLAFLLPSRIQIGVRHALPIVPFLIFPAAGLAAALLRRHPRRAAALGALCVAEVTLAHPRYIDHFSWLAGGPIFGPRVSIYGEDWAQSVADFGRFAREERLAPLHYVPYGHITSMELRNTGVAFVEAQCESAHAWPRPAFVAMHAATRIRLKRACGPITPETEPDLVFQDYILVFHLPADPAAASQPEPARAGSP